MPVDVMWDGPPGRRLRAGWRRAPTVLGALLVCSGALAVLPLIALTIAVGIYVVVWLDFSSHPDKVWPAWFQEVRGSLVPMWLVALAVTVVGFVLGLRLLRGNRNLILFLRRFGYRPATHVVTEATSRLGDFWRVVTLDDDRIESLAAGDGVERLVDVVSDVKRSYRSVAPVVTKAWKFGMRTAAAGLAVALVFVVSPGPDWTARIERLKVLVDPNQAPDGAAALGARIGAAVLVVGLVLVAVWLALMVVGTLVSVPIRLVYGGVSRGVKDAADADELHVVELNDIAVAKGIVERQRRRVFGARLSVLTVNSAVWQQTVAGMADISAVPLIDISDPTENVMWEIEELVRRFGDRCVFIGAYGRLQELAGQESDDLMRRLSTFLDGRTVLAYTPDAEGTRRFVRRALVDPRPARSPAAPGRLRLSARACTDGLRQAGKPAAANALAGARHPELVVIGIGHDDPIDLALADVDPGRPQSGQAIHLCSLIDVVGRSDVEMKPVLPDLRGERRTPGDERPGAVRRAYRGFLVLIPDQRPSKRLAPEVADLPRTVARDRSEAPAVSEEGVVRLDDAELVAFGVGENDMIVVWSLTDIDVAGAAIEQSLDRFLLVIDGRARQIEMDAILARFLLSDRHEQDPEAGVIRGDETGPITGLVVDVPVQSVGPEAREAERIVRIEAKSDEPGSHLGLPSCDLRTATLASRAAPSAGTTGTSEGHRNVPVSVDGLGFPGGAPDVGRTRYRRVGPTRPIRPSVPSHVSGRP